MSAVQEFILEDAYCGKRPILLVYHDKNDGEYLSLLLSNHLNTIYSSKNRVIDWHDHFFMNDHIFTLLENNKEKNNNDISSSLKLMLDAGFDTEKLYGLALPYQVFSQLNFEKDFNNSLVIYIYNEFAIGKSISNTDFVIKNLQVETIYLNALHLIEIPKQVIIRISNYLGFHIQNEDSISAQTKNDASYYFNKDEKVLSSTWIQYCHEQDFIFSKINLFKNKLFEFTFILTDQASLDLLTEKCISLIGIFNHEIKIHLYHNIELHVLEKYIELQTSSKLKWIIHQLQDDSIQIIQNQILDTASDYIIIDKLTLQYSVSSLILSMLNEESTFAFPSIMITEDMQYVSMSDLLSTTIPEEASIIDISRWKQLNGFDVHIGFTYFLWDYALQLASRYPQEIAGIEAQTYYNEFSTPLKEASKHTSQAYKLVLAKHSLLIESCLSDVMHSLGESNYSSLHEKKILLDKITSLQVILSHAKDELKSFHHLISQLHNRISYLENNWYQKVKTKIIRIKKIFFKKKSPGTSTLKKIFLFIRFTFSKAGFGIIRKMVKGIAKKTFLLTENRPVRIVYLDEENQGEIVTYNDWIRNKLNLETQTEYYKDKVIGNTLISIIMPVYNPPLKYLREAIESVIQQNNQNWELCIADDCSTNTKVQKLLHTYSVKDSRIKIHYRTTNGHISATSNDAIKMATGKYILLMDHDDLLSSNCLSEISMAIYNNPKVDIIYSDEDKIDDLGFHKDPHFKPQWAPDHLLSRNYIGHVCVLRKSIIDSLKGFRLGFEGSQDYDLLLRATELSSNIIHIPKVLYHWRIHKLSAAQSEEVKPYAYIAAKKALSEAIERRGMKGEVKYLSGLRGYKIEYEIESDEKVSIIIPTKDQTELLKNTIDSILLHTNFSNYEIIILNNNSTSKQLKDFLIEYDEKYPYIIKCVEAHFPFNFSKLMNIGAQKADGKYLLLLNNDVEVIHNDWLTNLVSFAQQKRIGAVGVKLLYPDDTIQHAGVIVGLGGIAGHSFVGSYKDDAGYFNYIQSVNNFSALTAACLMIRKDVFEEVNGMDETFEVEYNDVDFCLKIMEAGYNNVYLPQVELYHYESATRGHPHQSKASYDKHLKEMKLFKDKWQKYIDADPYYNLNLNLGVHDFSMNFSA